MILNRLSRQRVKLFFLGLTIAYVLSFAIAPLWFYAGFKQNKVIGSIYHISDLISRGVSRWSFFTLGNGVHSVFIYKRTNNSASDKYTPTALYPLFPENQLDITKIITHHKFNANTSNLIANFTANEKIVCQNYQIDKNVRYYYVMINSTSGHNIPIKPTSEIEFTFFKNIADSDTGFYTEHTSNEQQNINAYSFVCPAQPKQTEVL